MKSDEIRNCIFNSEFLSFFCIDINLPPVVRYISKYRSTLGTADERQRHPPMLFVHPFAQFKIVQPSSSSPLCQLSSLAYPSMFALPNELSQMINQQRCGGRTIHIVSDNAIPPQSSQTERSLALRATTVPPSPSSSTPIPQQLEQGKRRRMMIACSQDRKDQRQQVCSRKSVQSESPLTTVNSALTEALSDRMPIRPIRVFNSSSPKHYHLHERMANRQTNRWMVGSLSELSSSSSKDSSSSSPEGFDRWSAGYRLSVLSMSLPSSNHDASEEGNEAADNWRDQSPPCRILSDNSSTGGKLHKGRALLPPRMPARVYNLSRSPMQ